MSPFGSRDGCAHGGVHRCRSTRHSGEAYREPDRAADSGRDGFDDDLSALAERMDAAHDEAVTERVVGAVWAPAEIRDLGAESPPR